MFTKQHYEAIADVMAKTKPIKGDKVHLEEWSYILGNLVLMFQKDNKLFDPKKFRKRAGDINV